MNHLSSHIDGITLWMQVVAGTRRISWEQVDEWVHSIFVSSFEEVFLNKCCNTEEEKRRAVREIQVMPLWRPREMVCALAGLRALAERVSKFQNTNICVCPMGAGRFVRVVRLRTASAACDPKSRGLVGRNEMVRTKPSTRTSS